MTENNIVFDYEVAKRLKPGVKGQAKISEIREEKAGDIFKAKAKNPAQPVYTIHADIDGWQGRIATINKPTSKKISDKTKLALFMQRYGKFPTVGMTVAVEANDHGYWSLVI